MKPAGSGALKTHSSCVNTNWSFNAFYNSRLPLLQIYNSNEMYKMRNEILVHVSFHSFLNNVGILLPFIENQEIKTSYLGFR